MRFPAGKVMPFEMAKPHAKYRFLFFTKITDAEITIHDLIFSEDKPFHLKLLEALPTNAKIEYGPINAKNTIVEFMDYYCFYCKKIFYEYDLDLCFAFSALVFRSRFRNILKHFVIKCFRIFEKIAKKNMVKMLLSTRICVI